MMARSRRAEEVSRRQAWTTCSTLRRRQVLRHLREAAISAQSGQPLRGHCPVSEWRKRNREKESRQGRHHRLLGRFGAARAGVSCRTKADRSLATNSRRQRGASPKLPNEEKCRMWRAQYPTKVTEDRSAFLLEIGFIPLSEYRQWGLIHRWGWGRGNGALFSAGAPGAAEGSAKRQGCDDSLCFCVPPGSVGRSAHANRQVPGCSGQAIVRGHPGAAVVVAPSDRA